jgi:2'-5' RNA ligase
VPEQRVAEVLAVGAAATASSVTLRLDRLEHWPAPAVVCLVPSQVPRALVALATQLAAMLRARGLPADQRPWRPHVTLCRHLRRLDAEQVQSLQSRMSAEVIDWPVREFVLAESAHDAGASAYRLLARWPLPDPAAGSPP